MTNIKIIEKIGKNPGKNIVVLAGVHGNESFGCNVLDNLIPKLKIDSGKVVFIYANLEAIKQNKRYIDYNLNRCFLKPQPSKIKNALEGKTSREIIPYLKKADLMLDIHASTIKNSVAFIICEPHSFSLAKYLPFDIICSNFDKFEPGGTDYYMNLQGKIGICIECGYAKDPKSKERGEKALINFLRKVGSIKEKPMLNKNQKFYQLIDLYKNKNGPFKKSRYFADFEKLKEKTVIGYDEKKPIYANKGDVILFVHSFENIGGECFLIAREKSILS